MSSFFKRGRDTSPAPAPSSPAPSQAPRPQNPSRRDAPTGSSRTHIARGTKVVGEITGNAELLVDGVVEGEIRLDSTLVVGSEGKIHGTVYAVSVQVGGKVYGDVSGKERVEVLASGGLEGDIVAPSVRIAEGAFYKGKVDMSSPKAVDTSGGAKKKAAKPSGGSPKSSGGSSKGSNGAEKSADDPSKTSAEGASGAPAGKATSSGREAGAQT